MTRSILAGLAVAVAVVVLSGTGCQATGVGDPCTPEQEYDPTFLGYDYLEVGIEPGSYDCLSRLCLINHFQGRVTCPYGQSAPDMGNPPATAGCFTPGEGTAVDGEVEPQCLDRTASLAVYCSCRCANAEGDTNDGASYCTCPSGFSCTSLISSGTVGLDAQLLGSYCIKSGTEFNADNVCAQTCGGSGQANCGNPDNTGGT